MYFAHAGHDHAAEAAASNSSEVMIGAVLALIVIGAATYWVLRGGKTLKSTEPDKPE